MEMQDLIKEYETKTDDELLRLALDSEQLTPEATTALNNELAKRRINGTERLNVLRAEREHRKAEQRKNPGSLFVVHPYGIGRKRFGKAHYEYSSETGMERFKTTVFIVLFWLPLLPTGTYFVERKKEFLSSEMTVLERLPLDWEHVEGLDSSGRQPLMSDLDTSAVEALDFLSHRFALRKQIQIIRATGF